MIKAFQFAQTPKIILGNGKIAELPGITKSFGGEVLLVTGANSFYFSKHGEYLLNTFEMTGVRCHHIIIAREPSPEMIDHAAIRYRDTNIQLVIAIGGGSAIDAGKAISAMLNKTELVTEFLEGVGSKDHPGTKVPFIAVPTTSGTGSEATKNAVISRIGRNGFKRSLRHDNFVPDYAIVDPELTYNCPPNITAACGMDCFTQLVEAYLSDKSSVLSDALALDGIRTLTNSLPRAWKWGQDIEARTGMSYAALQSGICLANAGLGVVHGFASSVGALYNVPHGNICATLMATANTITVRKLREETPKHIALIKYAELGKITSSQAGNCDEYYVDAFLDKLHEWTDTMNIARLSSFGVTTDDIDKIVSATDCKNNPIKLNNSELKEILLQRI